MLQYVHSILSDYEIRIRTRHVSHRQMAYIRGWVDTRFARERITVKRVKKTQEKRERERENVWISRLAPARHKGSGRIEAEANVCECLWGSGTSCRGSCRGGLPHSLAATNRRVRQVTTTWDQPEAFGHKQLWLVDRTYRAIHSSCQLRSFSIRTGSSIGSM